MNKLVVYSCLAGDIDDPQTLLRSQLIPDPRVSYVLFTDYPPAHRGLNGCWNVLPLPWKHPNPRRAARFAKLHPQLLFPQAEASLWLDAAFQILPQAPVFEIVSEWLSSALVAAMKHPYRQCLYQERAQCQYLHKDDPQRMQRQIDRYIAAGYPPYYGLAQTGVLARQHTEKVRQVNERWWEELSQYSLRDQLSFNYVLWSVPCHWRRLTDCERLVQLTSHRS